MPFRWLFDEGQRPEACLDQLGYAEWVEFIFNHPAAAKDAERWYCCDEAGAFYFKDSPLFLRRCTLLFQEADLLLSRYSIEQIKQGFWCLITGFELCDLLEDAAIDFKLRSNCISVIEDLYRRLFRRPGFEKIAFTYWDPLTYSFSAQGGRVYDLDHKNIQNVMFDTLSRMLSHRDRITVLAALRGLGHLRHERGVATIRDFLNHRTDLSAADQAYAMARARGDLDLSLKV